VEQGSPTTRREGVAVNVTQPTFRLAAKRRRFLIEFRPLAQRVSVWETSLALNVPVAVRDVLSITCLSSEVIYGNQE